MIGYLSIKSFKYQRFGEICSKFELYSRVFNTPGISRICTIENKSHNIHFSFIKLRKFLCYLGNSIYSKILFIGVKGFVFINHFLVITKCKNV